MGDPGSREEEDAEKHKWEVPRMDRMCDGGQSRSDNAHGRQRLLRVRTIHQQRNCWDRNEGLHFGSRDSRDSHDLVQQLLSIWAPSYSLEAAQS